jgi:hypothetical protein
LAVGKEGKRQQEYRKSEGETEEMKKKAEKLEERSRTIMAK